MKKAIFRNLLAFVLLSLFVMGMVFARELTFEERVKAQQAIERVYYSHQIGATKPFEEAVPREVLQAKVQKYLQQTVALEVFWKTRVTDEMLQREIERMARGSRLPGRLRQLFAALNDDPFLIKECLARASLVDRLTRNFYTFDPTLHVEARQRAEELHRQLVGGELDPWLDHPDRTVVDLVQREPEAVEPKEQEREAGLLDGGRPARRVLSRDEFGRERARWRTAPGRVAPVAETREAFVIRVLLDNSPRGERVASYFVPKRSWDHWWEAAQQDLQIERVAATASEGGALPGGGSRPAGAPEAESTADDSWDNGILDDVPEPRIGHTAVWTGSEMVVWGGDEGDAYPESKLNTGGRYDPATDTWRPTSTVGAPSGRNYHTAVWTGTLMVIWGGSDASGVPNTGGRYDPVADTWAIMSTAGAPSGRNYHTAVWTGNQMVIWGGYGVHDDSVGSLNTGGRYDPATDTWTATSTVGAPSERHTHTVIWTGIEMVVWGGSVTFYGPYLDTGGRYDPATDTWKPTSTVGAPPARRYHTAVWTGSVMVVWGGDIGYNPYNLGTGGRYDPVTDTWAETSTVGAPSGRVGHTAVWTGNVMVILHGYTGSSYLNTGGRYNPTTDTWTATSTVGAPSGRVGHTAIWTGSVVVWGGAGDLSIVNTGGRYDPAANTWTPTSIVGAPSERAGHTVVWTGREMVVWGGSVALYGPYLGTGGRYDPATDAWTATSTVGAPSARHEHTALWTGSVMVIWGGYGNHNDDFNTGGRYDPATDIWTATSTVEAPSHRSGHAAVWTGSRMLVWGGEGNYFGELNTGGQYEPTTDTWSAMSTVGAPPGRLDSTAVWTGSRMVVWGGHISNGNPLITGGRYDPATDTWMATSTVGAPSVRDYYTAVWTGSVMVIWGGWYNYNPAFNTGARYDPAADTWTATSTLGAPSGRYYHTAVWTGSRMVVWGGKDIPYVTNTGGRYDPATDTWAATTTVGAPAARFRHTAVWTGSMMLVWGGGGSTNLNTGGRYMLAANGPPVASAGPDLTLECSGNLQATAPLDGSSSSDPDGNPLTCSWSSVTCTFSDPADCATWVTCPLSQNSVELVVNDGTADSAADAVNITVQDTTAPEIGVLLSQTSLWPPNHRMVEVGASVTASDVCSTPAVSLLSLTSSEPDDAAGSADGIISGDIEGADTGTADSSFQLRAERDGNGPGRTYTVIYTAVDGSGNLSQAHAFVVVPHDVGGSVEPIDLSVQENLAGTFLSWNAVSAATAYSVIRGSVASLQLAGDFIDLGTVACVRSGSSQTTTSGHEDSEIPPPGEVYFYLVEYNDGQDSGYGSASAAKPRISTAGGCESR